MNILFVSSPTPDYQNDVVLHGLRQIFGSSVVDCPQKSCMYKDLVDPEPLYGRGFTIFKTLNNINIDRNDIENKVKNRFFDLIIYGSARRNLDYVKDVLTNYRKNEIVFIDGEDDEHIDFNLSFAGTLFKRELKVKTDGVYPISFGFPEEKIAKELVKKEKNISFIIPNWNQSYNFHLESDYYNEYQQSRFAWTWKKAGWDCMRHYEILFNGCLPIFFNLEMCPEQTMNSFPKKEILSYQNKFFSKLNDSHEKSMQIAEAIDENEYNDVLEKIFEYSKNHLTTKHCAQSILSNI